MDTRRGYTLAEGQARAALVLAILASAAARALISIAQQVRSIQRIVATNPVDRRVHLTSHLARMQRSGHDDERRGLSAD